MVLNMHLQPGDINAARGITRSHTLYLLNIVGLVHLHKKKKKTGEENIHYYYYLACPPLKRSVVGSILLSGPSCSLGYFPFQPVVHNWFIKGRGMYCSVYGKVHIKDPLLLIEKSSLCGGSGFPSKKCVNVTI